MGFDPFGNEIPLRGRRGSYARNVENNLRFPGQYSDEETGLHQNHFRDYNPKTGRYLQPDPMRWSIARPAGVCQRDRSSDTLLSRVTEHLYVYANGNPVNVIDPKGLFNIFGDCCGRDDEIRNEVQSSCDQLESIITDLELRECIATSCADGDIRCTHSGITSQCSDPTRLAVSARKIFGLFPRRYFWLCTENVLNASFGDIALHEWAHGCGWKDNELGKGVLGETGKIEN